MRVETIGLLAWSQPFAPRPGDSDRVVAAGIAILRAVKDLEIEHVLRAVGLALACRRVGEELIAKGGS